MYFLQTERGDLLASHCIARIGPVNTRPSRRWHEVEYRVGREPRETTASAAQVQQFLEEVSFPWDANARHPRG
jgi:hypothetical protein